MTTTLKAGDLIKEAAKEINGSGGGKADLAQAGGSDEGGIERAFQALKKILSN